MTVRSFLVLLCATSGFSAGSFYFYRLYRYLRLGKNENRLDHLAVRTRIFLEGVLGQKKMFKDFIPGIAHATVFWGFLLITIGTLELIISGIFPSFNFSFLGTTVYAALLSIQDIFYFLVIIAILFFFYRRLILKPKRLEVLNLHSALDAYLILTLIGILMVTSFTLTGAKLVIHENPWDTWKPFAALSAHLYHSLGFSPSAVITSAEVSWWVHFLTVLVFFCYLPFSKHLHIVAAAPNVFFSTLRPRGRLKKLNLSDETQTQFGAGKIEDLSWKELLDGYACTECGRCNEFCPTYNTNKPLKPRSLIVNMRHHLQEKGKALLTKNTEHPSLSQRLIEDIISEDAVWDCTTCGACVEACPVYIEHVDRVIDYRRNLVLVQGKMEPQAQKTFTQWENYSNPWGLPPETRGDWAKELGIQTLAENPTVEYLYYVGCAASFDARSKKVAQAFAKLLLKANVNFGILGAQEKCNGESCRRLGNEYLAQIMIEENKNVLQKHKVKKILTTCPHCFNTLRNEYPDFDAHFEVIHHTQFLMQLLKENKLKIKKEIKKKITYHDPCYLGRYNEVYDVPRNLLKLIPSIEMVEMRRCKSKGFCCGAGGGRMWLEETRGERINVNRVEEALGTDPEWIATACPFCLTMIDDGLNAKNKEKNVQSKDIAEILEAAVF